MGLGQLTIDIALNKNIIFLSSDTNIFRKGTCKQNPITDHQTSNYQEMNYISLINDFFYFFSVLFRHIICIGDKKEEVKRKKINQTSLNSVYWLVNYQHLSLCIAQ